MVGEPVQQRRRHLGINKHGRPLREAQVGGNHHTGVLVQLGEQVKQQGNTGLTPERALQSLRGIQHHRVSIYGAPPLSGVFSMTAEHSEMFKALKVKTPNQSHQLSLL